MAAGVLLLGCSAQPGPALGGFDGDRALQHAQAQCAFGPRPVGSEALARTGDYIISQLDGFGWEVQTQEFEYQGFPIRNMIGRKGEGSVVILGAHYDTRPLADRDPQRPEEPIVGGNDGASGVAVLLELARMLGSVQLEKEVWLAFFDAEDRGRIEGWPFSVGARYMAEHLNIMVEAVIVVDMVGDRDQQLYYEGNSDPSLRERLWSLAAELGYEDYFIPEVRHTLTDDHVPFVERGIPAVDIIDFDYPYWHTTKDTCDKISSESLDRVGEVLVRFVQ